MNYLVTWKLVINLFVQIDYKSMAQQDVLESQK